MAFWAGSRASAHLCQTKVSVCTGAAAGGSDEPPDVGAANKLILSARVASILNHWHTSALSPSVVT